MVDAFQLWLNIPESKAAQIKRIVGSLHDASLLIDDIEDNSEMRRGLPVAHAIYGLSTTLNCANYVYFMALQQCNELRNSKAMDIYVKEMLNLHKGQGYDIYWREHTLCPTEEQYKQMVMNKTGGLFRLSVGLMQAFSEDCQLDFTTLLNKMAIYFQIRDDYMNLVSATYHEHKSFCEDLTEGKFSFPLIHAIRKVPQDHRLVSILKQKTNNVQVKKHALEFLQQTGALTYTKTQLDELKIEIATEIEALGGNAPLLELIEKLHTPLKEKVEVTQPINGDKPYI